MKKIIVHSYQELSELTASIVLTEMAKDKRTNIAVTAGSSPKGTYEILIDWMTRYHQLKEQVYFYNFDEIEMVGTKEKVTLAALNEQFYVPANISKENICALNYDNYKEYDQLIEQNGGLDLMVIGLGSDGHFCGNMPIAADFDKYTYPISIEKKYPWYSTFESMMAVEEIPPYFVTMGFKSLLKVKHLVLIINGTSKAEAVKQLMTKEISEEFPATVLRQHPNLTLILDKEAAALLEN